MSAADDRPGARPAPPVKVAGVCEAPGCTWAGSSGDNGHFMCIAHVGQEVRDLSRISERTHDLRWFAEYISDIQRMHNFPRKGEQGWLAYAAQYWDERDPSMQPQDCERRRPAVYINRMFAELRAMALGKERPRLHVPQAELPDFQPRPLLAAGAGVAP